MNIKIKIKNIQNLEIELLEDAKQGDVINVLEYLKSESLDFNEKLQDQINQLCESTLQKKLNEQEQQLTENFKIKYNSLEKEKNNEIEKKEIEINKIKEIQNEHIKNRILEKQKEIENEFKKEIDDLKLQINEKKEELNIIQKTKDNDIKNKVLEKQIKLEKEFNEKINKLNLEIQQKNNEINKAKQDFEIEKLNFEKQKNEEIKQIETNYDKQIQDLKDKTEEYKRERNMLGTKKLGNELEEFCEQKIKEQLVDVCADNTIQLERYTRNEVHETKADFVVKLLNKKTDINWTIVLEMKTENADSENKKTNESHINKLIKDAKNKKAQIAILVTELEFQDKFLFRRWPKSDENEMEVYIVRPDLLVYLLSCIRILFLKFSEIENYNFDFKTKEEILNTFNDFKKDILENQIKKINNNLESIEKSANKILNCANEILESKKTIMESHFKTLTNKIEKFKIEEKIANKIEKLK